MKSINNKFVGLLALTFAASTANAQINYNDQPSKHTVEIYVQPGLSASGLGNTSIIGLNTDPSTIGYGMTYGYTVLNSGSLSLSVNAGFEYQRLTTKSHLANFTQSYQAPATADIDNETYVRHTSVSDLSQKNTLSHLSIPIYVEGTCSIGSLFQVYADLGFKPGFKVGNKTTTTAGEATSYGIYPQYNDLKIDNPAMNDFGTVQLAGEAVTQNAPAKSTSFAIMAGAGLKIKIYNNLRLKIGVAYDYCLTDLYTSLPYSTVHTETTAPVTYTVANGTEVKSLTNYIDKSRLSALSFHAGFCLSF